MLDYFYCLYKIYIIAGKADSLWQYIKSMDKLKQYCKSIIIVTLSWNWVRFVLDIQLFSDGRKT